MTHTFVIAEGCSTWRFGSDHLSNAYRSIELAKQAGADAWKAQWVSDTTLMALRRNDKNPSNYDIICYPYEWLSQLKAKCDEVGIEFMCTAFIKDDIAKIAPLVKRFKVASAESSDPDFVKAHFPYKRQILVSYAFGSDLEEYTDHRRSAWVHPLHCVCSYPTPVEQVNLKRCTRPLLPRGHGLSDHTTSTLTGALAVAAGATIVEKHIRLSDTPKDNPDYGHSLPLEVGCSTSSEDGWCTHDCFPVYVRNIRDAELAMGSGENVMQECEKVNIGRRVKA